jgi:hypothetical protein
MSAETLHNLARSEQILSRALERIEAELGDRLHPGYRERFVRRWLFDVLERHSANATEFDVGSLGPMLNTFAPKVRSLLPFLNRLPPALRRAVLAVVLRPQDIAPAITRRLKVQANSITVPGSRLC